MSAAGAGESVHDHAHGHGHSDHAEHDGGHHGSMQDYLTGFVLSVVLTGIPFWIVWGDVFRSPVTAAVVVMIFAVAQIYVHMVYFLHMNARAEGGWNLMAAIFTIVLVVIALSGSMWIMSHLEHNMMPMPADHGAESSPTTPAMPGGPAPERKHGE